MRLVLAGTILFVLYISSTIVVDRVGAHRKDSKDLHSKLLLRGLEVNHNLAYRLFV